MKRMVVRTAPQAWLAAWIVTGIVGALVGLCRPTASGAFATRVVGALINLGHHLAVGLCAAALAWLWRFVPVPARRFRFVALAAAASVAAWLVLSEDFANVGENAGAHAGTIRVVLLLAAAGAIPITSAVARRARSSSAAWVVAASGLLLAGLNALFLSRLYPGVHLWIASVAAILVAEVSAPGEREATGQRIRFERALGAVLILLSAAAVAVRPSARIQVALLAEPAAVFAPFVARAHASRRGDASWVTRGGAWFEPRSGPAIAATTPRVLPSNAIVLLFTVDALRADTLSRPENATQLPVLSRLRDTGTWFSQARAPSPQTAPSIAAIFSGRFFSQLRWSMHPRSSTPAKTFAHQDVAPRFPELLQRAGVRTFTSSSSDTLLNEFGLARGFDEEHRPGWDAPAHARVLRERLGRIGPDERFFGYVHFMEPHAPYESGGREGSLFQRYVREVAVVDREIGGILELIERRGFGARTAVIVSGDHGEAFGEHNTNFHATTLYEELLHVPLVIRVPGAAPRRFDELVTLADLGPTLLDLMGVATPTSFLGQSLVPVLLGKPARLSRPLVAESGRGMRALYFSDGKKLIVDPRNGTTELYDLVRDPAELDNLYDAARDASLVAELSAYFTAHAYRAPGYEIPYRP